MRAGALRRYLHWKPIEDASFGLIYGAIMVLSLLMALDHKPDTPFRAAIILFGSIAVLTLARALANLLSHALATGERVLRLSALRAAWRGGHPILAMANVPTALFIAVGLDWLEMAAAVALSQVFCVLVLVILGARVGWVVGHGPWLAMGGAAFAGGLGLGLAVLKYALH